MRRILTTLILLAAVLCAVTAAPASAATSKDYLSGRFTPKSVDRFTRDLAKVGIGVYRPGAARPVRRVHGRRSPLRLSVPQARNAALGAWSGAGMSGAMLNALSGSARVSAKVSLPAGAVVAGWAKRARSPSARLARRILGRRDWTHYQAIVFPQAVLTLFASDAALHLAKPSRARGASIASVAAVPPGPCTAALDFVNGAINRFFDSIGHIQTDEKTIRRLFGKGWLGDVVKGVGDVLSTGANVVVDGSRRIALGAVKVPIEYVTKAIAGVSATVSVINTVANAVLPWSGKIRAFPNPAAKGVGAGMPGTFTLDVTAPLSERKWADWVVNCASAFDFELPDFTPKKADVRWDTFSQAPLGLIVQTGNSGPLNDAGKAELSFVTTTETPEEAQGERSLGLVEVTATVHRRDIEQLVDRVTDNLFKLLPGLVREHFGGQIRSVLNPMVNKLKQNIGQLQDIKVSETLGVIYHKQKGPKKPPSGGTRLPLPDPCKLVTQAEASTAAGTATAPGFHGSADNVLGLGPTSACIFADPAYPRAFVRIDVLDVTGDASARFAAVEAQAASSGLKSGEVAGLGDDNFYWVGPDGQALLYARKANIVFQLSVLLPGTGGNAIPLAKTVVGRI